MEKVTEKDQNIEEAGKKETKSQYRKQRKIVLEFEEKKTYKF
jgi:hypothetical protein